VAQSHLDWDAQNRLTTVRTPDDRTVRMTYDALGRRRIKAVDGERTFFAWDGDALLSERYEDEPAREYVYYPGTFEPLALIDGNGQVYYYHNDVNGLPCELTKPQCCKSRRASETRRQGYRRSRLLQALGNAGSEVLRLSRRVKKMAWNRPDPQAHHWLIPLKVLQCGLDSVFIRGF
jgi:YD repeat-containing protein